VREISTDSNKKLSLLGQYDLLAKLSPGMSIQHSKPSEFGNRFYATLELIEPPVGASGFYQPPKAAPQPAPKPTTPPPAPAPSSNWPNGATSAAPTWDEYKRMAFAAQELAWMIEPDLPPDDKVKDQFIDRSLARVAIVQSVLVAFREGKVQAPKEGEAEIPGTDAEGWENPEGFPWERAS
jgi:hypothetical protein